MDFSQTVKRERKRVKSIVKKEAKKLIDRLPDQATWDGIMYEFYVKKKLAATLKAAEEGHVVSHEEGKKRLLPK
jgi:predicted transcriptional regulator